MARILRRESPALIILLVKYSQEVHLNPIRKTRKPRESRGKPLRALFTRVALLLRRKLGARPREGH